MAYFRLTQSSSFTAAQFNTILDMLENFSINVMGFGIATGLNVTIPGGSLYVAVSDGMVNILGLTILTSLPNFPLPPSITHGFLWIDETGAFVTTTTSANPGGNVICLGRFSTNTTTVTSFDSINRQFYVGKYSEIVQLQGAVEVNIAGSAGVTLTPSQYRWSIIIFKGAITADIDITMPVDSMRAWTFVNSTTGAHTITINGGTGPVSGGTSGSYVSSSSTVLHIQYGQISSYVLVTLSLSAQSIPVIIIHIPISIGLVALEIGGSPPVERRGQKIE